MLVVIAPGLVLAQANNVQYVPGQGYSQGYVDQNQGSTIPGSRGYTSPCKPGYSVLYGQCVDLRNNFSSDTVTGSAPSVSISLNSSSFVLGSPLTVTWSSSGASSCSLSLATGDDLCSSSGCDIQGSMTWNTKVVGAHGISATCTSDGGKSVTQSVNYTVDPPAGYTGPSASPDLNPPTVSLSLNSTSFTLGSPLTVTWSSSGASSCDIAFADGSSICVGGYNTCWLNNSRTWTTSIVGSHAIKATCMSDAGKSTSQSVNYDVHQ
jgi:hypothetical protein